MIVRCSGCFRVERWDGAAREVEIVGGARRPAEAPPLAAWRVIARSLTGETGPVVGACTACGQPLVAEPGSALPRAPWRFDLPDGPITVTDAAPPGLGERLEALHHRPWDVRPGQWAFQGLVLSGLAAPFALWLFSMFFVALFLINYWRS